MANKVDLMLIEGEVNMVASLTQWAQNPMTGALGVSGHVFDYSQHRQLNTVAVSYFDQQLSFSTNGISAYSKPKLELSGGLGYHFSQVLFGVRIWGMALRHRPSILCVHQCVTHLCMLAPLKLLGVKVVPFIHNTFWPVDAPAQGKLKQLILASDAWYLKNMADAAFCASPEIEQQVIEMTQGQHCPSYVFNDDNLPSLLAEALA